MATVLTKQIGQTNSGHTSTSSLDGKKEPKVSTTPVDWPALGVAKDEKRFFWQKGKVYFALRY
jgi:hypothetical protein